MSNKIKTAFVKQKGIIIPLRLIKVNIPVLYS